MSGKHQKFVFTVNNPTDDDVELCYQLSKDTIQYLIIGEEYGDEKNTHHLQGFVLFKSARSWEALKKKFPRWHIEAAKASPYQNFVYCSKQGTFQEWGTRPSEKGQGSRTDIENVRDWIKAGSNMRSITEQASSYQSIRCAEKLLEHHEIKRNWKSEVFWYWGATGCGKTRRAMEEAKDPWISGSNFKWFQGYDGHEDVIFDDLRETSFEFNTLLRLLDRYPVTIEVKGGSRQFLARRIWITCIMSPEKLFNRLEKREPVEQLLRRLDKVICLSPDTPVGNGKKVGGNTSPDLSTPPEGFKDLQDWADELAKWKAKTEQEERKD